VLLIHGSGSWGSDTFGKQRPLADEFRLIMMDRRGYGQSLATTQMGWQTDKDDVAALLTELGSAHLVGHSTGGTAALLAAAMVPQAVRSLVVVEPTVWGIADPAVSPPERPAAYQAAWTRGQSLSAREFLIATTAVTGLRNAEALISAMWDSATEADLAAAEAMRQETWAGGAPIDVAALAAADFPKLVVVGAWDRTLHPDLTDMWDSGWRQAVAAAPSPRVRRQGAPGADERFSSWPDARGDRGVQHPAPQYLARRHVSSNSPSGHRAAQVCRKPVARTGAGGNRNGRREEPVTIRPGNEQWCGTEQFDGERRRDGRVPAARLSDIPAVHGDLQRACGGQQARFHWTAANRHDAIGQVRPGE
jgi:pimeloyl-ACP methyl ester carboxylesterase